MNIQLSPHSLVGSLAHQSENALVSNGSWYLAQAIGDGLRYEFPAGTLADAHYLSTDLLADGTHQVVFALDLQEGADGPTFRLTFGALNQCTARLRLSLAALTQNCWRFEREGALLKPLCGGDAVDPAKVDRMLLTILRKTEDPVRCCFTPFLASTAEPERITDPVLPKGPLLDELGQSTLHQWPEKTRTIEELIDRLREQLQAAPDQCWPTAFSRWGGWTLTRFEPTGFFRTLHDGARWWLIDPDGCVFWSAGLNCVGLNISAHFGGLEPALTWIPERTGDYATVHRECAEGPSINFLRANFIRAFGPAQAHTAWQQIAIGELRRLGFNTVANWSDWPVARAAGFPYVRPLSPEFPNTPMVFRDFPDVFHPAFEQDAAAFAQQLVETRDDPALIGYFLMNEPTWGFAAQTPAEGMWINTAQGPARDAFLEFLRGHHRQEPLPADFAGFSTVMVEKLFRVLSEACRKVDPNHLNLGARYYTVPPDWALAGMDSFDVFSVNCYEKRVHAEGFAQISAKLQRPVMVGEWHFGALDAGLPASGIGRVQNQAARGQAYRVYLEDAASKPWCIGAHWFTLYDQSALGRFDGENYNIGFLDTCHRPYEPLAAAARASHERMYQVASQQLAPYDEPPEYLTRIFV